MAQNTNDTETKSDYKQNSQVILEMEHLRKSFGNHHVLKDINLKINKGENLAILGQSGTGKSVLIKCIAGLVEIDDGKLSIFGQDIAEIDDDELFDIQKKIGFLFQSGALYDSMTVSENLEFPLRRKKRSMKKETIKILIKEALENVGLSDTINEMPSELSGGMRKRLGLARTLILKPEIMLYDEPTTGLDPITSKEISKLILDVQRKYKTTSIIITHDIDCARITSNRCIIIRDGICYAEGTYADLNNSTDAWIKSFFE